MPVNTVAETFADLAAPLWVDQWLGGAPASEIHTAIAGVSAAVRTGDEFTLVSARLARAARLSAADLEDRTVAVYAMIAGRLAQCPMRHPVRIWNYIPRIGQSMGQGLNRYMVFNRGRYNAYAQWLGSPAAMGQFIPTASGVGHEGVDLVVHVLAAPTPGAPLTNPRQIDPRCYSQRWGPLPPCFARATVLNGHGRHSAQILVGGTASVCGEDSVHAGDLRAQFLETVRNLASLIHRARNPAGNGNGNGHAAAAMARDLRHFRHLRVYYVRAQDRRRVRELTRDFFPSVARPEMIQAPLCRPELLVEIEGVAQV